MRHWYVRIRQIHDDAQSTDRAPDLSMANYRIGPKRRGVTWSNNVIEGNGRLVFKGDFEFAIDRWPTSLTPVQTGVVPGFWSQTLNRVVSKDRHPGALAELADLVRIICRPHKP